MARRTGPSGTVTSRSAATDSRGSSFSALLLVWLLGSCSEDQPTGPPSPSPASISVLPETVDLAALGDTVRLAAEVRDRNGNPMPEAAVTWSSSAAAVATVDATGLLTAAGNGTATVTASAGPAAGSAAVAVRQAPATISLVPDSLVFEAAGDTATVTAAVADANGHPVEGVQVAWASRDAAVATVSAAGLVTAVARGSTEVTARAGGREASAAVTVEFHAVSISLDRTELLFTALGEATTLTATAVDLRGNAGGAGSIRWASEDTTVAAVDPGGRVTAAGNGTTSVSATSGEVSARVPVTVRQVPATLSVAPDSLVFEAAGDTATLMAAVTDANGHGIPGAAVGWASDDPSVATVDAGGLVTAVRQGSTAVAATLDSLSASAGVEVFEVSSDRDVLRLLYRMTGGDGWRDNTNWLTDAPLSEWAGVTTYTNGRVRYLQLRENGLDGPIPRSLGRLDQLFILGLAGNSLSGRIPPEIGQLRQLRDLYLDDNELSGPLPPELGGMAGLRFLGVSGNGLSGAVPETFARLTLDRFYFGGTHLCIPRGLKAWLGAIGETEDDPLRCIPVTADREALTAVYGATDGPGWEERENWLSELPINTWSGVRTDEDGYVTELILPDNDLRGSLPREIGDLSRLERLLLHGNDLSGRIPPEIGRLSRARTVLLSGNQLEGRIPPEIGGLVSADTLYLSRNNLSGPIPSEVGSLESLVVLALFENELTGPLPPRSGS